MVNFDDGNVVSAVQGWKAKHACEAARGRIMFAVIFWGDNYELRPNLTFFFFWPHFGFVDRLRMWRMHSPRKLSTDRRPRRTNSG